MNPWREFRNFAGAMLLAVAVLGLPLVLFVLPLLFDKNDDVAGGIFGIVVGLVCIAIGFAYMEWREERAER